MALRASETKGSHVTVPALRKALLATLCASRYARKPARLGSLYCLENKGHRRLWH